MYIPFMFFFYPWLKHCNLDYGSYTKDLSAISCDLSSIFILDNSPGAYRSYPGKWALLMQFCHTFLYRIRAVPEIILGGHRHFFALWGEGVLFTMCPRGGGGVNLSWGSRRIWSIVGWGLIKALTCPEGWGALTPCVSWGWRVCKKMCPPRIISGTALSKPWDA